MNDLEWMKTVGGDAPKVPASVLELPKGRRVAVVASRCVFFGVRLDEDDAPDLPAYADLLDNDGSRLFDDDDGSKAALLRTWLTREYAGAELSAAELRAWCAADGGIYGYIGGTRLDRGLVDSVLSHAPEAETVTVGFVAMGADGEHFQAAVLTWEGFRAVIAPARTKPRAKDEPFLALPEKAVTS